MSYDDTSAEAEAGRLGESAAIRFFRSRGYGTFNANDGRNVAPMLARAADGDIIMPDLQLYIPKAGMRFVEVKWKLAPVLFQVSGTFRHGVDLPNWEHYVRIQDAYDVKIGLAIVQVKECRDPKASIEPRLLAQSVDRLKQCLSEPYPSPPNSSFPNGAAYWDVSAFKDMGPIHDLELRNIPATHLHLHPWERVARDGTLPKARPKRDQPPLLNLISARRRG